MTARVTARARTLLGHDLRLQRRYGIFYAYAFVLAFYAAVLVWAGPWLPSWLVGAVVYSDPAVVGFFFLGALMMLERAEGARMALAITPVAARDYLTAKAASLGLLAVAASALLAALAHASVRWGLFLPAVGLTALTYLCLGVPIALWFRTVSGYLIGSAGLLMPLILPCGLAFLDPMPRWAMLWPFAAQLKLILAALGGAMPTVSETALLFAAAAVGTALCAWIALVALEKEFGRR